jgi:hypothetical protein
MTFQKSSNHHKNQEILQMILGPNLRLTLGVFFARVKRRFDPKIQAQANISLILYLEEPVKETIFVIETATERLGIKRHQFLPLEPTFSLTNPILYPMHN